MRITVLAVPGCPNAPVVRERIHAALAGRVVPVDVVEVRDAGQAARWGMTGSPTVLFDGADPFGEPAAAPSVSCRLYRGADGCVQGAPGVGDLRRALESAGRAGRGRLAPAERGLRAVQRQVLWHFATTGSAPEARVLEPVAARFGRPAGQVLAELAAEDFLTLDGQNRVQAAYPFSAVPTAHRVSIAGEARVWAMCAIDALGIPAMLDTDVVITSCDPRSGKPVTVTATGGRMVWEPDSSVVFVGSRCCAGPAAEVCCDALNFFTDEASVRRWADDHPDVLGEVVGHERAEHLGARIFGPLLSARYSHLTRRFHFARSGSRVSVLGHVE